MQQSLLLLYRYRVSDRLAINFIVALTLFLGAPLLCPGAPASFGSFEEAYVAGKSGLQNQDFSAAQEAFKAALELAPDALQRARAREGLADCLLGFQDYDGCRALAEQTLEDSSGQSESSGQSAWSQATALRQIAESYRREKRFDEMTVTAERAEAIQDRGIVDWLSVAIGRMFHDERLFEQSMNFYRKATNSPASDTRGWSLYWLARAAGDTGQKEEALEYLEQFRQIGLDDDHLNRITGALHEEIESSGR